MRRDHDSEIEELQANLNLKIEQMDKRMSEVQEELETVKLERDKLEKQAAINNKENNKQTRVKDSDRAVEKLKDKLKINQ